MFVSADGASTQHTREPRVHSRDHVRVLQRPGSLHRRSGTFPQPEVHFSFLKSPTQFELSVFMRRSSSVLHQAVLALAASWTSRQVGERTLTGTVIDSGDGVTHVIPVVSVVLFFFFVPSLRPRSLTCCGASCVPG